MGWLDRLAAYLQSYLQPRYAMALASVAVLVVAGFLLLNRSAGEDCPDLLACIPDEAIEKYVRNNIEEFDTGLLEQHLAGRSGSVMPSLELEDMEEYLDDVIEDMDIEDLEDFL